LGDINAYQQAVKKRRDVSDPSRCGKPETREIFVSDPSRRCRKSFARRLLTLLAGAKLREPRKLMMTGQKKNISSNPRKRE
jgi:hypothetical protein